MSDPGCYFHGEEQIPSGSYTVCRECGHCFVTEQDLLEETRNAYAEAGLPAEAVPTLASQVYVCPLCAHDF